MFQKKKKWTVFFILPFIFLCFAPAFSTESKSASSILWHDYSEGMALSKEQGKKVFLYFWAKWCGYCTKMAKETFVDPQVIDYLNSRFISIKIDYDREPRVASRYGVRGLPTAFFIAETGDPIGQRPGFISAKDLIATLQYIQSDSYKTMSLKTFLKGR